MPESFLIKLHVQAFNFITKETLAQLFSCEFCEISKNTFFTEHLWATASLLQQFSRRYLKLVAFLVLFWDKRLLFLSGALQ